MPELKPEEVRTLRPGWKTTEFWVSLAVGAAPFVHEALPATWKATLAVVAGGIYTLARGLAKLGIGR